MSLNWEIDYHQVFFIMYLGFKNQAVTLIVLLRIQDFKEFCFPLKIQLSKCTTPRITVSIARKQRWYTYVQYIRIRELTNLPLPTGVTVQCENKFIQHKFMLHTEMTAANLTSIPCAAFCTCISNKLVVIVIFPKYRSLMHNLIVLTLFNVAFIYVIFFCTNWLTSIMRPSVTSMKSKQF